MYGTDEISHEGCQMMTFDLYILYRPPTSRKNDSTLVEFLDEMETLLCDMALLSVPLVLVGDFNIHLDVPSKAKRFSKLLDSVNVV